MPTPAVKSIRVLLVEDNPGDARMVSEMLREASEVECELQHEHTLHEALAVAKEDQVDIVLLDLGLPDSQGLQTLKRFREHHRDIPLVVFTNESNLDVGVRAVHEGAQDYLLKDHLDPWLTPRTLRYAIERKRHEQEVMQTRLRAQAAEVRAAEAENARASLEREIQQRKNAEQQVTRLNEELEQRIERLALLHGIDRLITTNTNLETTLDVLVRQIQRELPVDAVRVLLYQEENLQLETISSSGFPVSDPGLRPIRLGEGTAGKAAFDRRKLSISNLSEASAFEGLETALARGFTSYRGMPLVAKGKLRGWIEAYHREPLNFAPEWLGWFDALAEQAVIAIDNAGLFRDLQRSRDELALAYDRTIEGWAKALGAKDEETAEHSNRVTMMTVELAKKLGITGDELVHTRRGALLHDIGKMAVPDRILFKPGPLDDHEWEIMKCHPTYAYEMLAPIRFLRPALDIPYAHHERWDGTGYPRGLAGEGIPLPARIFTVVDAWDALSSDRPYRKAWPPSKVERHLRQERGKQFDPNIVDSFLELLQRLPPPSASSYPS